MRFPDGEKYVRILDDVKGENVALIQSMYRTPDEFLLEYLLLADTASDLGAKRIAGFMPYFAYARQDERFNPGEALSFKTVAKLIESVGTSEVYSIDMHEHRVVDLDDVFKIPAANLTAMPLLTRYVRDQVGFEKPVVIGPDEEARQWAKFVAESLGVELYCFQKKRRGPESVEITKPEELNVRGRPALIIDDIISTGGTIIETVKVLKKEGATKVGVACVHPILAGNALDRIKQEGPEFIVGTDTVPSPISEVSVAPVIADKIRKLIA